MPNQILINMKKHHQGILKEINRFFETQSWNLNPNLIKSSKEDENFILRTLLLKDSEQSLSNDQRIVSF